MLPSAAMDYRKLREMVSHRVTFEFDSGAKVVGYIGSCVPATGPVQMVMLSKVQVGSKDVVLSLDQVQTEAESLAQPGAHGPMGAGAMPPGHPR